MSLNDFVKIQIAGMHTLSGAGVMGMHLVSGPLVGFGMGYGFDWLLGTGPWGKLAFFVLGIAAGFLNVYRDTRRLLKRLAAEDAKRGGDGAATPDHTQPQA